MEASSLSITLIVGSRIGPECLAIALDSAPSSKFIVGVTPRADHKAVDRVIASFPDHSVELSQANVVLQSLADGARNSDWLLNLWGELIIGRRVLDRCRSSLNIHPSMLPWARGSDPIVWTILNGWPAGATLHAMTSDVDAGPIWVQREVPYEFTTTGGQLYEKVLNECLSIFRDYLPRILAGEITAKPQVSEAIPARRIQLLENRDASLSDPKNAGLEKVLRLIQAYDFGPGFSARVVDKGRLFRLSLTITPEEY